MAKRVQKEAKDLALSPPEGCTVTMVDNDLFHWRAVIEGPPDSPYEGGKFELDMRLPANYPFAAPKCVFLTKVYHPNVSQKTGDICLDILKEEWTAALSIATLVTSIRSFLLTPNEDFHLEPGIGAQFVNDRGLFLKTAREWTQQYAGGNTPK